MDRRYIVDVDSASSAEAAEKMKKEKEQTLKQRKDGGMLPLPPVWVTQWVDTSHRYGMSYVLSNGNAGMVFNDASRVSWEDG